MPIRFYNFLISQPSFNEQHNNNHILLKEYSNSLFMKIDMNQKGSIDFDDFSNYISSCFKLFNSYTINSNSQTIFALRPILTIQETYNFHILVKSLLLNTESPISQTLIYSNISSFNSLLSIYIKSPNYLGTLKNWFDQSFQSSDNYLLSMTNSNNLHDSLLQSLLYFNN